MAENPLLPNRRLKELLARMHECRALDSRTAYSKTPREALLAATTIQLEPGDILLGSARDKKVAALAPAKKENPRVTWKAVVEPDGEAHLPHVPHLALAAAMAQGLRCAGSGGLVLAVTNPGSRERGLAATLAYAQQARLPLLLAVAGSTKGKGTSETISLQTVEAIARKLGMPFFPVDGEDAVAVYRVMQECTLRARNGEGPAILWGMLLAAASGKIKPAEKPIARMEKYLSVRGLLPKSKPR